MSRRVVILGSTGSIGVQALDVIERSAGELEVVALTAGSGWEPLLEQARAHGVERVALERSRRRRPRLRGVDRR